MVDSKDSGSKPPPVPPHAAAAKPAGGTTGMGGPSQRPRPPMQSFTHVQSSDSDPFARPRGPCRNHRAKSADLKSVQFQCAAMPYRVATF